MQKHRFRHQLLVSACCVALCYLCLGSAPAAAQGPVLPSGCLPPPGQSTVPPNCHVVRVGPPSFSQPFGDTFFFDLDSGSRSDDPALGGQNPVITVIPAGHTIQWQFFYGHSSTAGHCPDLVSVCNANGNWDSGIRSGVATGNDTFTRTFAQPGVFTYFCGVHFGLMRGIVVVLGNATDYDLFANPDPTLGPPPPTPALTIFAGDSGNFSGTLNFYNRFNDPLTLTCTAGGTPRNPTSCLTTATPVAPVVPTPPKVFASTTFNFPVSEATGGDYTFEVAASATPQPPPNVPFSHKKTVVLHVNDLDVTLAGTSLTALRGETSQTTAQAKSFAQFSGNVSMSCNASPAGGPNCSVTPSSFFLAPGASQNLNIDFSNTFVPSNNYTVSVVASSSASNPGPGAFTRTKSLSLALKPADRFVVTPMASSVAPGSSTQVLVQAVTSTGAPAQDCDSTIHFTSSDSTAGLPSNFTFSEADDCGEVFPVTFNTAGPRTVTVTDTSPFATTGTSSIIRVDGADTVNSIALSPNLPPLPDAYFKHPVTFTATVIANPAPQGSVQFFSGATPIGAPVALAPGSSTTKSVNTALPLTIGDHSISAVFLPSSGNASNMSETVSLHRFPSPRCVNDPAIGRPVCPGSH